MNTITKILIAILVVALVFGILTDPVSLLAGMGATILCFAIYFIVSMFLNI